MSNILKGIAILILLTAIPFTSVGSITIAIENQNGTAITENVTAVFLDENKKDIVTIDLKHKQSWGNHLHWWSHNKHKTSLLHPNEMKRVTSAYITAENCEEFTLPIVLKATYNAPSPAPHGGGLAYWLYEFKDTVQLQCKPFKPEDNKE